MERTGNIYIIKNHVNDLVYIGQTLQNINSRFLQHTKPSYLKARKGNMFYDDIEKYGRENFYVELLESNVPQSLMKDREIYYIEKYDSFHRGYNSTNGGDTKYIYKEADVELIYTRAKSGESCSSIADDYNVNKGTIFRTLHDNGYYIRDNLDKDVLQDLVNQGLTNEEIAHRLNSKEWTVKRRLHDYGIRRNRIPVFRRDDFNIEEFKRDVLNNLPISEMLSKYNMSKSVYLRTKQMI